MHRKHPKTRFVNAHMAMLYYDPAKLSTFLDTYPADIELSATFQDLAARRACGVRSSSSIRTVSSSAPTAASRAGLTRTRPASALAHARDARRVLPAPGTGAYAWRIAGPRALADLRSRLARRRVAQDLLPQRAAPPADAACVAAKQFAARGLSMAPAPVCPARPARPHPRQARRDREKVGPAPRTRRQHRLAALFAATSAVAIWMTPGPKAHGGEREGPPLRPSRGEGEGPDWRGRCTGSTRRTPTTARSRRSPRRTSRSSAWCGPPISTCFPGKSRARRSSSMASSTARARGVWWWPSMPAPAR